VNPPACGRGCGGFSFGAGGGDWLTRIKEVRGEEWGLRRRLGFLSILVSVLMVFQMAVFADNVQNDIVTGDGRDTITAGGSTTVGYWIHVSSGGNDKQSGCNAADGTPAVVTINAPAGVSASTTSLTFAACGQEASQSVTYSSSTPGSYEIKVSVSDACTGSGCGSYNVSPAKFTLTVNAPAAPADTTPPTVTLGGVSSGWYLDSSLPNPTVGCTDNAGGSGCDPDSYWVDTQDNGDGTFTATAHAADNAGNWGQSASVTYSVVTLTGGGAHGKGTYKMNSTIPVSYTLSLPDGANPLNFRGCLQWVKTGSVPPDADSPDDFSTTADSGCTFRYDESAGQYIFNLSTKKVNSTGTFDLYIRFGNSASANKQVKIGTIIINR
jgi:hypothetical protein